MVALLAPTPAAPPAPRDRSWTALVTGVVALVSGVSVLLVGAVLPDSPSYSMAVPGTEVNPAPTSWFDAAQVALGATKETTHAIVRPEPERASGPDPVSVNQSGPGIVRADRQQKAIAVRSCKGTRPESTHLATTALCRDLRDALALMAEAQHRGRVSGACPCPMGVPSYRSAWGNSDDRIANAQFGTASSGHIAPCVPGSQHQDLAQIAFAQGVSRCADGDRFLMSGRIAAAQNALFFGRPPPARGPSR